MSHADDGPVSAMSRGCKHQPVDASSPGDDRAVSSRPGGAAIIGPDVRADRWLTRWSSGSQSLPS